MAGWYNLNNNVFTRLNKTGTKNAFLSKKIEIQL